jgi:hypothetical protein
MHKLIVLHALAIGCAGLAGGCGLQATTGWQGRATRVDAPYAPAVMAIGTRFVRPRGAGLYLGADLVATTPAFEGDVAVRQLLVGSGYRAVLHPVSVELGAELGAGEPALERIGGTGFYVGAAPALLFRLYGEHDARTGYAVAGALVDLVAIGRIGVWGRPAEDRGDALLDGGGQLGLRFTFITDIVRSSNDDWEPPP